jgi:hypothetical protein
MRNGRPPTTKRLPGAAGPMDRVESRTAAQNLSDVQGGDLRGFFGDLLFYGCSI